VAKEENIEKPDGGLKTPKTRIERTRAAIEAILSTTKQPEKSQENAIKPFVIEKAVQINNTFKNPDSIPIETIPAIQKPKVPGLDLNRKIMADQRKLSSTARKSPDQRAEIEKQSLKPSPAQNVTLQKTVKRHMPSICPQHILIKEIVARDIEKMYKNARLQKQQKLS
jgi:hypothetical protein